MKKQFIYTLLILCMFGKLCAQTFTPYKTYTYSRTYLEPVTYNASSPASNNTKKQVQSVQYTDGLGRPKQDIAIGATYGGNDLVSTYFYDPATGRQTRQYLPVAKAGTLGAMQGVSEADINNYYGVDNAFAEVKTENSPLSRPIETAAPGNAWKMAGGKTKKMEYLLIGQDEIKKYTAVSDDNENVFEPVVAQIVNYAKGSLHKLRSTDEDGNVAVVYKNSLGQTLVTRQENGAEKLDTHYLYNQYGQLVMIVPPKASAQGTLDQTAKDQLCYIYRYDAKGRLIEKKLPGKGKEQMVYDKADRLILYRDAKMTTDGKWLLTKYDTFGRVVYTGFFTGWNRADLQNLIANMVIIEKPDSTGFGRNGLQIYYSNDYFADFNTALSVNYYDTYPTGTPAKPTLITETTLSSDNLADRSTKTMPTAYYVKNISDDSWTKTYYWYDQRGRSIGAQEINHLGGVTITHTELDWAGITQKVETRHQRTATSTSINVKERFVYNTRNYLQEHYHQVNSNAEELLAKYTYNELGQVTNKQVGGLPSSGGVGGGFLQSIDYNYNVRGWLTNINNVDTLGSKLFAYKINYNQRDGLETPNLDYPNLKVQPRYNGNIAEVAWKAVDYDGHIPAATPQRQGFVYDKANRISAGLYQLPGNPAIKANSEIIENYDPNGNITKLKRTGMLQKGQVKMIDNLTYNIVGNRLSSVTDAANNITGYEVGGRAISYDANGNMTAMADKGISAIAYNFLNLPEQVTHTNVTKYYYRADGVKTKKAFTLNNALGSTTTNTEYLDGFVYTTGDDVVQAAFRETDSSTLKAATAGEEEAFVSGEERAVPQQSGMVLAYFPTAEGYYDYTNNRYIYQYKDHLGNVRSSYTKNSAGALTILDRNDYYAFGMNMYTQTSVYDATGTPLNNKYNQKELQETGFYDYGWRQYMPDLGRWFGMDKLSETYSSTSPYAYVMNNPVMMFDPDGKVSYSWIAGLYNGAKAGGETTYSDFDSNGNWGSSSFSPMGSGEVTSFYNFLAGGGTGNYTYFTGTASMSSSYNSSQGAYNGTMDLGIGHNITIKDNSQNQSGNWLDVIGTANDYRDNIGGAFADNAGLTRLGTNGSLYFPTANGRVFYGNQFVRTASLAKWGKLASKGAIWVNVGIGGYKTYQGIQQDGGKFGYNAQRASVGATAGVLSGWGGAEAGAYMGAEFGATVGSLFPGAGTAIGGVIGGVAGGIIGAFGGGMWGQAVGEGSVDAYY
ncbi:MAG: DUF6443 domain-containing protein [Weeksellaceae bacterium]|nr:DUF6443 domain-containing protein [Weeksellaceae bacterium]